MADQTKTAETLKRAFVALERSKKRVRELEQARNEPIAVISMACRLPGDVTSPEELWTLLDQGKDAVTEMPRSRFDVEGYFDADPEAVGKMYSRWGGFVGNVDSFDAPFLAYLLAKRKVSILKNAYS